MLSPQLNEAADGFGAHGLIPPADQVWTEPDGRQGALAYEPGTTPFLDNLAQAIEAQVRS